MRTLMNGQEIRKKRTRGRPKKGRQNANTGRVPVAAIPGIILLVVALMAVLFYLKEQSKPIPTPGLAYEANTVEGGIPGKIGEERQGELDSIVQEDMLSMPTNATPSGRTNGADRTINWLIEDLSNQGKLIRVEISREDTGDIIYETGVIPPGNYVESAPLKVDLPSGQYNYITRFCAYKEEDEAYLGQAAVQIKLVLYEDEEGEETGNEKTN